LTSGRILGIVSSMLIGGISSAAEPASYLGPVAVVASKDGKRLFVANTDARQIAVVDVVSGKVTRSIEVPAASTGMVLDPDGASIYVTHAGTHELSVIDAKGMLKRLLSESDRREEERHDGQRRILILTQVKTKINDGDLPAAGKIYQELKKLAPQSEEVIEAREFIKAAVIMKQ